MYPYLWRKCPDSVVHYFLFISFFGRFVLLSGGGIGGLACYFLFWSVSYGENLPWLCFFFCLFFYFFLLILSGGLAKIWSDGSQSVAKCRISFGENVGCRSTGFGWKMCSKV